MRIALALSPGRILLAAIVVVVCYFTFSAGNTFLNSMHLSSREKTVEQEVHALQEQVVQLERVRDYVATDEYVEFMARRLFGLVKPGETLVVVDAPPGQSAAGDESLEHLTWWQRLFEAP